MRIIATHNNIVILQENSVIFIVPLKSPIPFTQDLQISQKLVVKVGPNDLPCYVQPPYEKAEIILENSGNAESIKKELVRAVMAGEL